MTNVSSFSPFNPVSHKVQNTFFVNGPNGFRGKIDCKLIKKWLKEYEDDLDTKRNLREAKFQELRRFLKIPILAPTFVLAAKQYVLNLLNIGQYGLFPRDVTQGLNEEMLKQHCESLLNLMVDAVEAANRLNRFLSKVNVQECLTTKEKERIRDKIDGKDREKRPAWIELEPGGNARVRHSSFSTPVLPSSNDQLFVQPLVMPPGIQGTDWLTPEVIQGGTIILAMGAAAFLAVTAPAWVTGGAIGATVLVLVSIVTGEKPGPKT